MSDKGKYVVVKYWNCDMVVLVFPNFISHSEFVSKLGLSPDDIDSAGFVSYGYDSKTKANTRIRCSGRSSSLNKDSNPERDEKLVLRLFKDPYWDD